MFSKNMSTAIENFQVHLHEDKFVDNLCLHSLAFIAGLLVMLDHLHNILFCPNIGSDFHVFVMMDLILFWKRFHVFVMLITIDCMHFHVFVL